MRQIDRNAAFVTPAMGASTTGGETSIGPIRSAGCGATSGGTAAAAGRVGCMVTAGIADAATAGQLRGMGGPRRPPCQTASVRQPVSISSARVPDPSDDSPKEACGVFGVHAYGQPVAHLTYLGLYALQHRGQESAGMAVSDGELITVVKDMGLVSTVFDERVLAPLTGHLAIGQTRYSTTGSSTWRNAQPVFRGTGDSGFALGHNGNLTNTEALALDAGMLPGTVSSDSDLVAELVAAEIHR